MTNQKYYSEQSRRGWHSRLVLAVSFFGFMEKAVISAHARAWCVSCCSFCFGVEEEDASNIAVPYANSSAGGKVEERSTESKEEKKATSTDTNAGANDSSKTPQQLLKLEGGHIVRINVALDDSMSVQDIGRTSEDFKVD